MSTSTPQQPPSPSSIADLEAARAAQFATLTRTLSYTLLLACPAIAALPPRKLDLYTFGLGAVWVASASHITHQRTGQGIWRNVASRVGPPAALPTERAREVKRELEERRVALRGNTPAYPPTQDKGKVIEERGVLERVWMGQEEEGWKEKRLREEREALEEGRGYGDLILEQVWEVWNWGKGKGGDGDEKGDGKKGGE
ncbi:hypothetical protein BU16DRAFT_611922 [Lophium mytilinum]|uniref:Uncharacterized protein n=1 Tax=Lophium mytilinum TaxID=390894 RepID=A0A6A6RER5_9PEZI|nr:hypothetical protein BU16DRAFT_611922 [Lophium mytilinum]